jgi:hypothetical protein
MPGERVSFPHPLSTGFTLAAFCSFRELLAIWEVAEIPLLANCIAFTSKPTQTYGKMRKWQRGNQFAQPTSAIRFVVAATRSSSQRASKPGPAWRSFEQ